MKKRILIVEDAPYMREMLVEMLKQEGEEYEVVGFAVNGKEAVERYKNEAPVFKKEQIIDAKGAATEYWVSEKEKQKP